MELLRKSLLISELFNHLQVIAEPMLTEYHVFSLYTLIGKAQRVAYSRSWI